MRYLPNISILTMATSSFLNTFVSKKNHDEANDVICELFAQMRCELARQHFKFKDEKPQRKKKNTENKICVGVTAKGISCTNKAFDESDYCRIHGKPKAPLKKKAEPKPKGRKPKSKTVKKVFPQHTHPVSEESVEDCKLCQTQGNSFDPNLKDAELELI